MKIYIVVKSYAIICHGPGVWIKSIYAKISREGQQFDVKFTTVLLSLKRHLAYHSTSLDSVFQRIPIFCLWPQISKTENLHPTHLFNVKKISAHFVGWKKNVRLKEGKSMGITKGKMAQVELKAHLWLLSRMFYYEMVFLFFYSPFPGLMRRQVFKFDEWKFLPSAKVTRHQGRKDTCWKKSHRDSHENLPQ